MPLLNEAGLLHVSPTSTYVGLTRAEGAKKGEPDRYRPSGKRTFGRIIPADHHQATAMAELIVAEGVRRLHLVHDRDVYGRGLAELVGKAVRKAGVEVTGTDGIDRKAGNFRGLGNKVSRLKADGVFFGGSLQSRAVQVFRDIGQRAPSVRLFGPDAVALPGFAEEIGKEFEPRVHLTSPALPPEATPPEGREVLKAFREKYQSDPTAFTVYGYEAMSVVLDAIDRAGSDGSDRAHVVDAFFATRSRRSALGTYSIDANGDTTLTSYGAYRVKQGKLAFDRALGSSGD
jgi:branched-chain amino acid transport system substrate-binding protein